MRLSLFRIIVRLLKIFSVAIVMLRRMLHNRCSARHRLTQFGECRLQPIHEEYN